ncbi:hypothetical protein, partial [Paraclostridium bifermentans]|uniref:hypothetical protein n=1 Tax=Paraclostridium bifermentans TaxID=1490 RepID=UPI00374E7B1A
MLDKANKLLLSAQSHVHSLKDIEDLNFYEDMKKSHLDAVDSLEVDASAEVLGVLDKIRILYRFSDNYV